MKKHLLIYLITLISTLTVQAQELKFSELNESKRGRYTSYVASDGSVYKVGDKVKIGMPSSNKTFAFIYEGDGLLIPMTPLQAGASGQETEIKWIGITGTKRTGFQVTFRTKGMIALSNYSIQFEQAVASGEVVGYGMTSDQALTELKKAKDKLDLGLITQEEYEKIKEELSKYIK
jgi:hypothetical protein